MRKPPGSIHVLFCTKWYVIPYIDCSLFYIEINYSVCWCIWDMIKGWTIVVNKDLSWMLICNVIDKRKSYGCEKSQWSIELFAHNTCFTAGDHSFMCGYLDNRLFLNSRAMVSHGMCYITPKLGILKRWFRIWTWFLNRLILLAQG